MLKKDNAVDKKRTFDKINSSQSNNNNNKYQDDKHSNNNSSNGNGNHSNNIGNHNKINVVNTNNHNNNKRPEFTGSIINRKGNKIHFPGTLKRNIVQTSLICKKPAIAEIHAISIIFYCLLGIMKMKSTINRQELTKIVLKG